jgi:hypothetical protein
MQKDDLLRFVVSARHPPYGHRSGVFTAAYTLRGAKKLSNTDHEKLCALLAWFEQHLSQPEKFAASPHPRAQGTAISWIRASARDHVTHLRQMVALLGIAGIVTEELRTSRPGYVIYSDDHQVVALPFADTPS